MIDKRAVPLVLLTMVLAVAGKATSIQVLTYTEMTQAGLYGCIDSHTIMQSGVPTAISSSVNCSVGQFSTVQASSSASGNNLSGLGYIYSNVNHVEGGGLLGFKVSSSLSEMLLVEGGAPDGTVGFIGVLVRAALNDASDYAAASVTLGSENAQGTGGIYGGGCCVFPQFGAELMLAAFNYGTAFPFALTGETYGAEGGNSTGIAGYSLDTGQPILFSALPMGYSLGLNRPREDEYYFNGVMVAAGPGTESFLDATAPEPGTVLLGFGGLVALVTIKRPSVTGRHASDPRLL